MSNSPVARATCSISACEKFSTRITSIGCFTIAEERPRHLVRSWPCRQYPRVRIAPRNLRLRLCMQDDVIAIEQSVFRRDAIRRRREQGEHESHAHRHHAPHPMPQPSPQCRHANQDHQRQHRKHVPRQHRATQHRERHDVRRDHDAEHQLHRHRDALADSCRHFPAARAATWRMP